MATCGNLFGMSGIGSKINCDICCFPIKSITSIAQIRLETMVQACTVQFSNVPIMTAAKVASILRCSRRTRQLQQWWDLSEGWDWVAAGPQWDSVTQACLSPSAIMCFIRSPAREEIYSDLLHFVEPCWWRFSIANQCEKLKLKPIYGKSEVGVRNSLEFSWFHQTTHVREFTWGRNETEPC